MARVELDLDETRRRVEAATGRQLEELHRMTGGASSLTYGGRLVGGPATAPEDVVVKVAPPGVTPTLNRDVLRQARVLRALAPVDGVPVPTVRAEDAGSPPEVPPLFVMARVTGESIEPITHPTEDDLPTASDIRGRELAAAEVLAALHGAPLPDLGLGDEPPIDLSAEVQRWIRIFETTPEDLSEGAAEVGARLLAALPDPVAPKLIHGDFRLGNLLCEGPGVRAVIDWEIWAVGDPRIDLGWWLMSTHPSKQPNALRVADGMPSDDELVATYESAAGTSAGDLSWFEALSRFKAGAMTALIMKHDRRRDERDPVVLSWEPHVPTGFVQLAAACLEQASAPRA